MVAETPAHANGNDPEDAPTNGHDAPDNQARGLRTMANGRAKTNHDKTGLAAKAGRPRVVSNAAILDAALRIADDAGLEEVTFRALGSALGVSAMSIHRATGGIDALRHALVVKVVEEAVTELRWPENDWGQTVIVFARSLRDLLMRHPLVLEAHRKASLDTPGADSTAHLIVDRLRACGLSPAHAAYGYAAVHDFVTGHVAIRLGRGDLEAMTTPPDRRDASVFAEFHDYDERFEFGLGVLIDGLRVHADLHAEAPALVTNAGRHRSSDPHGHDKQHRQHP